VCGEHIAAKLVHGRSTDKETRWSEQRKYRRWTAQQTIEIVLAGLHGDCSAKEANAGERMDALLRGDEKARGANGDSEPFAPRARASPSDRT